MLFCAEVQRSFPLVHPTLPLPPVLLPVSFFTACSLPSTYAPSYTRAPTRSRRFRLRSGGAEDEEEAGQVLLLQLRRQEIRPQVGQEMTNRDFQKEKTRKKFKSKSITTK